jgi:hypothetical protein
MPVKLFSIDVKIYATAYILAETEEEAQEAANGLKSSYIEVQCGYVGDDLEICGGTFSPDMPELSLSPAMTIHGPDEGDTVELVEEFEEEDA